jgi:3-deoxy-D-manno-octulosonic acid kinase
VTAFEEVEAAPGRLLLVRADRRAAVLEAGLLRPGAWEERLHGQGSGRGRSGRLVLPDGALSLKRMRRGGILGRLWKDRFLGRGRLVENVTVAREAVARGVATPAPVALLTEEGPPGFFRGWLATELVEEARDLAAILADSGAGPAEIGAALRAVRAMHDAGIEHRDLNLGNLLLRRGPSGLAAFVIDLDCARARPQPLPPGARRAALRRLERSHAKLFGTPGPQGGDGWEWYEAYAAGDAEMERILAAGRPVGRLRLALHRRLGHRRAR